MASRLCSALGPSNTIDPRAVGTAAKTGFIPLRLTINKVYTKLVVKSIMAFSSPESAGIPRLAHIVFMVKSNPQYNSHKKSEFHLSSQSRTTAAFVPRCLHSQHIFYGHSMIHGA